MEPELVKGDRGGRILTYRGFRYQQKRISGAEMEWRCWRRETCVAGLRSNVFAVDNKNAHIRVFRTVNLHNHPEETAQTNRALIRKRMRAEAQEDPTRPSRCIYDAVLANVQRQGGGDIEVSPFESVRSAVERTRSALVPPIPTTVEEVNIDGPWAETWLRDMFLLRNVPEWGIVIYATDQNIRQLERCETLYMDATFRVCPRPYVQFFTILGDVHGFIIPLVQVLMEGRTTGHYQQVFREMKTAVRRISHHRWRPTKIVADFEQALHSAIETELPGTRRAGCYFHFTQNLWKRVKDLGHEGPYRQNPRLKRLIRQVMSIGYLSLTVVNMNFNNLVNARRSQRYVNRYPALVDFFAYVRNTYVRQQATFSPALWNVFDRNMSQRTNNHVEAYHRALGDVIHVRHPSLWSFLRVLKDRQAVAEQQLAAARRGQAPPTRRRKWRVLEANLIRLKNAFRNGDRNLQEYWRAVSHQLWDL
ncbi:hypothetical protein ACOMHN_026273 [Nucella lapillus]